VSALLPLAWSTDVSSELCRECQTDYALAIRRVGPAADRGEQRCPVKREKMLEGFSSEALNCETCGIMR
jgi:hypothetical protein